MDNCIGNIKDGVDGSRNRNGLGPVDDPLMSKMVDDINSRVGGKPSAEPSSPANVSGFRNPWER